MVQTPVVCGSSILREIAVSVMITSEDSRRFITTVTPRPGEGEGGAGGRNLVMDKTDAGKLRLLIRQLPGGGPEPGREWGGGRWWWSEWWVVGEWLVVVEVVVVSEWL
ncbi:unnamed protein product [Boreogadus saida]